MPEPKKSPTKRRQGNRRSQINLKLARRVNAKSPIKVFTTRRETPNLAKKLDSKAVKRLSAKPKAKPAAAKTAKKPAAKAKPTAKKATKK